MVILETVNVVSWPKSKLDGGGIKQGSWWLLEALLAEAEGQKDSGDPRAKVVAMVAKK